MNKRAWTPWAGGAVVALLTIGCTTGTEGELSNGSFGYVCTMESDTACSGTAFTVGPDVIPDALAVGSQFNIVYTGETPETEDGTSFSVSVVAASPTMVDRTTTSTFTILAPGQVAFIARGSNGQVTDFVHVTATPVASIDVTEAGTSVDTLDMSGYDVALDAAPRDATGQTLGGGLAYEWSSSDTGIVSVSSSAASNIVTLSPRASGSALVLVRVGDVSREIPVSVEVGQ